jgi:hypothetical protein
VCYDEVSSSCSSGCAADEWCYNSGCYTGQACWFDQNSCETGMACDGVVCLPECSSSNDCPLDQECILANFYNWNVVDATKVCKEPECRCRLRDDICRSNVSQGGNQRYCLRAVQCNEFSNPCPEQPNYTCSEQYNYSCLCNNDAYCGPTCLVHQDCNLGNICDPIDSQCKYMNCTRDSDCPVGSQCACNGSQRFCSLTGDLPNGASPCNNWSECQSGMCIQLTCMEPCADNDECSADVCGSILGASGDQAYPFCFAWASPCDACGPTQFCDINHVCVDGPACTRDEDCPLSYYCEWSNKTCWLP